jgi:putative transferase (TIGR04331 family)
MRGVKRMTISCKNIRATADEVFWGGECNESIYLWEGAKYNLSLHEIEKMKTPTMEDLFSSMEMKEDANEYCKMIYHKLLPSLTAVLNEIHGLRLPETFWKAVFGFWLFAHVCVVYEKFSYLSKLDIDNTSIKLMDKDSFYYPNDYYDHMRCFCSDFGVQQLVSQYYYLYLKGDNHSVPIRCAVMKEDQSLAPYRNLMIGRKRGVKDIARCLVSRYLIKVNNAMLLVCPDPKIAICCVHFESDIMKSIIAKSKGQIRPMDLPYVKIKRRQLRREDRKRFVSINSNNQFEEYLANTLYYCVPKILVEYFRDYYDTYLKDIQKKRFTHIVTEVWKSFAPTSIYVAIAQQEGRKVIFQQHGCSSQWIKCNSDWLDYSVADNYLTTGWAGDNKKIVQGGFSCRNLRSYEYEKCKKDILYVGTTRFPYTFQFVGIVNSNVIKYFKIFRDFFKLLPDHLKEHLILRPRSLKGFFGEGRYCFDAEKIWDTKANNIRICNGVFSEIIYESKILIIDHLSTGVGEILNANIPCMIIHDGHIEQLEDEYSGIFDDLIDCGVVHRSAESAVLQLAKIYDDVEGWWKSDVVQNAHKKICSGTYDHPSNTVNYLLSCLGE